MTNVSLVIKDDRGRFVFANRQALTYFHVSDFQAIVGKSDFDFFPFSRAKQYLRSDQEVLATGLPLANEVELAPEVDGSRHLILRSKYPLKSHDGTVMGVVCIFRPLLDRLADVPQAERLAETLQTIHEQFGQPLRISDLARQAWLSTSRFQRVFREIMGISPSHYVLRVRIDAACQMLINTQKTTTAIALDVVFFDHSHFTRRFQRLVGQTPNAYRKAHSPKFTGFAKRT